MKREQDLIKKVRGEISDFYSKRIPITVVPEEERGRQEYTYDYSQRETVAVIDLYWNSQFRSGKYDSEGRQKIFLNVGKFRTEVAEMQIDIDIANFRFLPASADLWSPWFMSRDFHQYVRDHDYGQVINSWGGDLPKYGTCVSKRVGDEVLRVPIGRLINTPNAESLKKAALSGGYVIEAMEMTPHEMAAYPDWNISDVDDGDEAQTVYERYGLITEGHIKQAKRETPADDDWEEWFLGLAVIKTDVNKKEDSGALLFAEKIDEKEFPYEEAHWQRQDGRWLGIGEMENQFMNQLASNVSTHLRQKSMYWAAKKIFTKTIAEGPNNLAKDVADGGVIDLGANGAMSVVNTQTQHLGDFNSFDNRIEGNADKVSFTYEAATGESPKAGTPFSLQVQLDRTLQKHYGKKRENFGLFLKRAFFNHQVDIFKKKTRKEHTLTFAYTDEDAELLREGMIYAQVNGRKMKHLLAGKPKLKVELEAEIREELTRSPYMIVDIPAAFYDNAKYHTRLIITGEEQDVGADMQTLVTLWQTLQQAGDPRAEKVLERIMSLSGSNLRLLAGARPAQPTTPAAPEAPVSPVTPTFNVAA